MRLLVAIALIFSCTASQAEDCGDYWELYETYASSDATKYHDILQSIEAGDLEGAKEKLLSFQASEVMVLEQLQRQRGITERSENVIEMVREYNDGVHSE